MLASPLGAPPRTAPRAKSPDLQRVPIGDAPVTLGRDAALAQIVIAHPAVSRAHAMVRRVDGRLVVADLGSTNGTFVDGRRVTDLLPLSGGASLEIGPAVYVVDAHGLVPRTRTTGARLTVDGVSVAIGPRGAERTLLTDVSLTLEGGSLLCVLGPSGCGKSTLLKLVAGRLAPTTGRVLVDGGDVHRQFDAVRHRLGYVPQREALRDELTVADMLRYTARLRLPPDLGRAETDEIIIGLAERTGLADRLGTRIGALSGGQRRRLGLVNEFVARPSLALLDEVTTGLDEEAAHELMALVQEFAGDGMTVLCVTHTVAAVKPYADACLVLAAGGVPAFLGPPAEVARHFGVASLADVYARLRERPADGWRRRRRCRRQRRCRRNARAGTHALRVGSDSPAYSRSATSTSSATTGAPLPSPSARVSSSVSRCVCSSAPARSRRRVTSSSDSCSPSRRSGSAATTR